MREQGGAQACGLIAPLAATTECFRGAVFYRCFALPASPQALQQRNEDLTREALRVKARAVQCLAFIGTL